MYSIWEIWNASNGSELTVYISNDIVTYPLLVSQFSKHLELIRSNSIALGLHEIDFYLSDFMQFTLINFYPLPIKFERIKSLLFILFK